MPVEALWQLLRTAFLHPRRRHGVIAHVAVHSTDWLFVQLMQVTAVVGVSVSEILSWPPLPEPSRQNDSPVVFSERIQKRSFETQWRPGAG